MSREVFLSSSYTSPPRLQTSTLNSIAKFGMCIGLGEVGAILIGFRHVFFYTDYPILDKCFELCPFMQSAIPHENHVDDFFLTHSQTS